MSDKTTNKLGEFNNEQLTKAVIKLETVIASQGDKIKVLEDLLAKRNEGTSSIDANVQDLLFTHLCSKIATQDEQEQEKITYLLRELVKTLSGELILHLITTIGGLPIEVSFHNLAMQSDIPA